MAEVNVRQNGVIEIDDCIEVEVGRYISLGEPTLYRVDIALVFDNLDDAARCQNLFNASIQVGCLHIHFCQLEKMGGGRAH